MGVEIWMIGKTKEQYLRDGIASYEKRTGRYLKAATVVIADPKHASKLAPGELRKQEAASVLKRLAAGDFLVLLDEKGAAMDSAAFSSFLEERLRLSAQRTVFLIGGAYGFDDSLYRRGQLKLRLSKMTFSHQLVRLILWEQLYRAVSIMKGLPYHNG